MLALHNSSHVYEFVYEKAEKYVADKPQNSTFLTFAMGTQCELGPQAMQWLERWAKSVLEVELELNGLAPTRAQIRKLTWEALVVLGVAMMKAQAKQIFDHATSATRRRFNLPRAGPAAARLGGRGQRWSARAGR